MHAVNPERLFHVGAKVRLSRNCRYPLPELLEAVGSIVALDNTEASVQWDCFGSPKRHLRESLDVIRPEPARKAPRVQTEKRPRARRRTRAEIEAAAAQKKTPAT
jgi:hypothetical protein